MRLAIVVRICLLATTSLVVHGCASTQGAATVIQAEVVSIPESILVTYRGKSLGPTPLTIPLTDLSDAVEVSTGQEEPPLVERRIKILGPDQVRVELRLGYESSEIAEALGLRRVVVFDYGERASFEVNKFDLKPSLRPLLERQAAVLESHFPGVDVFLCGHTDGSGKKDFNRVLSLQRAQSVADFLMGKGLSEDRLQVQGFGADYPLATNTTEEGRALNRRTEIVLPD